jgi:hypothetical protein
MSDLTIGAADIAAVANQVNSVSQLLGSLIQLQLNLDAKIANAFEAAIDAIVEEKKAVAEIDAPEIDRMSDVEEDEQILEASDEDQLTAEASSQNTSLIADEVKADHDGSLKNADENLEAEQVVQNRALEVINQFRDELVRRAPNLDLLSEKELVGFAKSLLEDDSLEAAWQAKQNSLDQEAAERRNALARLAEDLKGSWPRDTVDALAEDISANVVTYIDALEADQMATDFLACTGADSISSLVARSTDTKLDSTTQRAAAFDALLAMTYAERLLNEQVFEAWNAVETGLRQLPEASVGRKRGEAVLAIAEQIPEAETRQAVESYYNSLAEKSTVAAGEVLDRLLASQDTLLFEYLVRLYQESNFSPLVAQALSPNPEISAQARREIELADLKEQRERPRRVSPFESELEPAGADFHLAKTEVFEAVRAEILKMDNLVEAVELHAEGRLRTAIAVLELVDHLKEQGMVETGNPVAVGGALFQLGKGCQLEDSEAAHKLAGQIYIGIDQDTLAKLNEEQRRQYRLDTLLQSDAELESLARVLAASTTVLPSYVNNVDSLWESKGLRDALEQSLSQLIAKEAANADSVEQTFEMFRAGAMEALELASAHNEAKLRQLEAQRIEADAVQQGLQEAHLARMQEVIDLYKTVLAETDANEARISLQQWLATVLDRKKDQ